MSNVFLKSLLVSPAILAAALTVSASAIAAEAQATNNVAQPQASALQPLSVSAAPQIASPEVSALSVESATVDRSTSSLQKSLPVQVASTPTEQPAAPASTAPADTAAPEAADSSLSQINRYTREGRSSNASQVTSVSQLSDVKPTDWAFQALQSLVERYGCIAGYPDRTYRGNRATTRYEFAAGLNACLDRVNELIAAGTADLVKKEDLAVLQKLQEEFAAELATLRGRVDSLEARTATLEKQQFSTTTKLAGEAIFAVTDEFGQRFRNETVFQDRVRLAFNTSFTGKDLLVTRLAAGNFSPFRIQDSGRDGFGGIGLQSFQFGSTGGNSVFADWVAYFFPLGDKINVYIPAFAGLQYDYAPTQAGLLEGFDSGTGPLSVFAERNPIYNIGGGSGIGLNFDVTNSVKISLGYLANNSSLSATGGQLNAAQSFFGANNPADKAGLFNGSYSALAQVAFKTDFFSIGATYVNAYTRGAIFDTGSGGSVVGTSAGNFAFVNAAGSRAGQFTSTSLNAYGLSGSINLGKSISVNAFGTYIEANKPGDGVGRGEIWTYGVGLGLADFGKKGNLLGLTAGVEPYLGNARKFGQGQNTQPIHFEAFYRYQLSDNISITPGVIYVINPGQNNNNDDVFIGTLRTTFTF